MPKTRQNSKVRSTATKNSDRWHRLPLISRILICAVLLLTVMAISTIGYYKFKETSLQAQARGLSLRYSNTDYSVKACKVWFSEGNTSRDPDIYVVKAYYDKGGNEAIPTTYIRSYDYTGKPLTQNFSQRAWYFRVSFMQMYATRDGFVSFNKSGTKISMYSIGDC